MGRGWFLLAGLALAATFLVAHGASAGSAESPELSDPQGDAVTDSLVPEAGVVWTSSEADIAKVWVDGDDAEGIRIAFRFHAYGRDDWQASEYGISLGYAGASIRPGATEDGPLAPATKVTWQSDGFDLLVPHANLPGKALRGQPLTLRNATAASRTSANATYVHDATDPAQIGTYLLAWGTESPLAGAAGSSGPGVVPPEAPGAHAINLILAENNGCSDDRDSPPDLRATVRVDGVVVLSEYGDQVHSPLYAAVHRLDLTHAVAIEVQVEEAEPGGFMGWQDVFHECDVTPGSGTRLQFNWDGSDHLLDSTGSDALAARVVVMLGATAPPTPALDLDVGARTAAVRWGESNATGHALAGAYYGKPFVDYAGGLAGVSWVGLCDDHAYPAFRVLRQQGDWVIGSKEGHFKTANVAPQPPEITSVLDSKGSRHIRFEEATAHDIVRYTVMGWLQAEGRWAAATELTKDTTRHDQAADVAADVNASAYKVVAWDAGGLSAESQAFQVGDPALAEILTGPSECPFPPEEATVARRVADPQTPNAAAGEPPVDQQLETRQAAEHATRDSPSVMLVLPSVVGVAIALRRRRQ